MDRIELIGLRILVGPDEDLKVYLKFHKSLEKQEAIELLEASIEELKEVLENGNSSSNSINM